MSTEQPFALSWAYSPCPNDTYIFYALAHNKLAGRPVMRIPHLCDIAELNDLARRGAYDVIKISAAIYPEVAGEYQILASGGAFGVGVGPILVARDLSLPKKNNGEWQYQGFLQQQIYCCPIFTLKWCSVPLASFLK